MVDRQGGEGARWPEGGGDTGARHGDGGTELRRRCGPWACCVRQAGEPRAGEATRREGPGRRDGRRASRPRGRRRSCATMSPRWRGGGDWRATVAGKAATMQRAAAASSCIPR